MTRRGTARREPESTRDRLIEAAVEVFLAVGYDGARVQDIARKAGVTTGAIYAHFRDKADLLVKAFGTHGVNAVEAVLLSNTDLPVASLLRALSEIVVEGELDPAEMLLLDATVAARREPELREQLTGAIGQRAAVLTAMIERARKERVVADDVPREPNATGAENASLVVEDYPRPQIHLLGFVHFLFREAADGLSVFHRVFLELAFAGLIADGTIQRMIDEQRFEHRFAHLLSRR